MNAVEAIVAVRSAGGSVAVADGALLVDAPPSLPAAVWEALATHKATLVELLAPRVTYAELAAHEERVAIQAAPPAAVPTFERPAPARRCRIIRDTPWECPDLGRVTFPAGLEGVVVESPDEIEDPLQRLALAWVLKADSAAGKATVPVLIDGRPRVLDRSAIIIEGSCSP